MEEMKIEIEGLRKSGNRKVDKGRKIKMKKKEWN